MLVPVCAQSDVDGPAGVALSVGMCVYAVAAARVGVARKSIDVKSRGV